MIYKNEVLGSQGTRTSSLSPAYKKITIGKVPESKLKSAIKKGIISLSANDLSGDDYQMMVHPDSYEKVKRATKSGRGTRIHITPMEVIESLKADDLVLPSGDLADMSAGSLKQGGSIWKTIWSGLKKAWPTVIKPALSAALDVGAPALGVYTGHPMGVEVATAAREGIRRLTGVGVASKPRLAKGSQEAKDHMAKLREMRKQKKLGSSFRLS